MAFVGVLLVNLIFVIILLTILLIAGIILLIIGFNKKKKNKINGKTKYKLTIILGFIFLLIPLGIISFTFIGGASLIIKNLNFSEISYDTIVDEWKNEKYVLENGPRNQSLETFLEGMNNKDKDLIKSMFSDKMKSDPLLEEKINEIFDLYPEYLSVDDISNKFPNGGNTTDNYRTFHALWEFEKDNRIFYLYIDACYFSKNDKTIVGINSLDFYEK